MLMWWAVVFRGIQKRHHGHNDQSHASRACGEARFVWVLNDLVGERCMLRKTDKRQSGCSAKGCKPGRFRQQKRFWEQRSTYVIIILGYFDAVSWSIMIISEPTKQSLVQGDMFRSHFWLGLSVIDSARDTIQVSAELEWKVRQSSTVGFIKQLSWPCRNPWEIMCFLSLLSGSVFLAVYKYMKKVELMLFFPCKAFPASLCNVTEDLWKVQKSLFFRHDTAYETHLIPSPDAQKPISISIKSALSVSWAAMCPRHDEQQLGWRSECDFWCQANGLRRKSS